VHVLPRWIGRALLVAQVVVVTSTKRARRCWRRRVRRFSDRSA